MSWVTDQLKHKLENEFKEDFYDAIAHDGAKHYNGLGTIRRDPTTGEWSIEPDPAAEREVSKRLRAHQ